MKPTDDSRRSQSQNGLFGRIPTDLEPELAKLSNLSCRVFMFLSIFANFKREPIGEVCMSKVEMARRMGIDRKSFYRGLAPLVDARLVALGHNGCVLMPHYLWPHATVGVASGHADPPKPPVESTTSTPPIRSEEDHKSEEEENSLRVTKDLCPAAAWDVDLQEIVALDGDWFQEFEDRWAGAKGADWYNAQLRKANDFLARNEDRRESIIAHDEISAWLNDWMIRNATP